MPSKKRKYEARFPPARIKKIIQTDEEIGKVAAAVPVIISRSLEIFLQSLVETTAKYTNERKAKTMTTSHLKHCIENEGKFDFLKDLVANIADIANEEEDGGAGGGDNVDKPKKQRKPRQTNQEKKKKKKETSSEEESDAQSDNEDVGQTQRSMPSSPNSSDDIHGEEASTSVGTAENQSFIAGCADPKSNVQAASSSSTHTLTAPRNGHSSTAMPSPKHVQAMPSPKHVQTMPSPKHVQTMPSPKHVQSTHNTSPYASPHHNIGNPHAFPSPQQAAAQHSPMDLKHTGGGCTPSPNSMGDKSEKEYLSQMYSKDNKLPIGEEQIATNSSSSSSTLSSKLSHPAASLSSKLSHSAELSHHPAASLSSKLSHSAELSHHPAASLNMPSPVRSPYGMTSPSVPSSLNLPSTATLTSPSPKLPSPLNLSSRNVPSPIYMPDELSLSQKILKNISHTCQGSSTMVSLEGSGSATSMHSNQHNLGESTSVLPTYNLSRQSGNITKSLPGNITKPIPGNITKPMISNITKPISRPSHSIESIMGITSKDSSVNQNREELRQSQTPQVAIATSFMPNFNLHGNHHGSHGNEPPIATSFQPNFSTPFKLTKDDEEDDYDT